MGLRTEPLVSEDKILLIASRSDDLMAVCKLTLNARGVRSLYTQDRSTKINASKRIVK